MKPLIITISLAVLFTAKSLFPRDAEAGEFRIYKSGFCFYLDFNYKQNALETWMYDSDYFDLKKKETDIKDEAIEEWMTDYHHFNFSGFRESARLEKWMCDKNHFYRGLTYIMPSRNASVEYHRNSSSLLLVRK